MYMDVSMDSGDIISQKSIKIQDSDTVGILWDKMSFMGRDLLLETLPSIMNGTNKRIKQDESLVTFGLNIKREEEHIDFNKTSREIFNRIRGLNPWPSANVILDDLEMKVYDSMIGDRVFSNKENGEICDITKKGISVKTSDGEIILTDIKPFGKKRMDATSYVNGIGREKLIGKVFK